MRDNVDQTSAIAFVTLMLDPHKDTVAHERAQAEFFDGDQEALIWGLATVAQSAIDTLALYLEVPPETVVQTIAESFAAGEFFET